MQTSGKLIYTLRIGKQIYTDNGVGNTLILIEGREEISAPFCYSVLLGNDTPLDEASLTNSSAALDISLDTQPLVRVAGVVTGVAATRQYPACKPGKYWYIVRLEPPVVKACFTKNRQVFTASEMPTNNTDPFIAYVLKKIGNAYTTTVTVSEAARKRLPALIQLLQHDESDYNFLARILSAFGLGYVIKTNDKGVSDSEQWVSELHVLDMTATDDTAEVLTADEQKSAVSMSLPSSSATQWRRTIGFMQVKANNCTYTPYGSSRDNANGSVVNITEAPGSQVEACIKGNTSADASSAFPAHHNNTGTARGCTENIPLSLGRAVTRSAVGDVSDTGLTYKISKVRLVATGTDKIKADVWARLPMQADKMAGLGLCPSLLTTDDKPDTSSDTLERPRLLKMKAQPPRERLFPAVVCSAEKYDGSVRHLCKVREVGSSDGQKNEFWVEVGSIFADVNSGIHVRPRKGNVLLCSDLGDLGMPVAVSSLYRGDNSLPNNTLMGIDQGDISTEVDSTITISNRSCNSSEGTDASVGTVADITRPCSVYDLREQKGTPNCSRIQLMAQANKASTCPEGDVTTLRNASKNTSFSALPGIILGIPTGKNAYLSSSLYDLAGCGKFSTDPRSFLQGINIYSEKDLLQQSAGSHHINAGGNINLTAAEKITLRVGRNSITISETGITIQNGYGSVKNPGASSLYNATTSEDASLAGKGFVRKLSNTINLKQDGISLYGTCSQSAALYSVAALTTVGSTMGISITKTGVSSPAITLTGGAAIATTLEKIGKMLFKESMNYADSTVTATCMSAYNYATTIWSYVRKFRTNPASVASQYTNLLSVKGAQLSMKPTSTSFNADKLFFESRDINIYCHPLANYRAMCANAVGKYGSKILGWMTSRFSLSKHLIVPGILEMKSVRKMETLGTEEQTAGNVTVRSLKADDVIAKNEQKYVQRYNAHMGLREQAVDRQEQDVNRQEAAVLDNEQNQVNGQVGANNNNAAGVNMVNGVEMQV